MNTHLLANTPCLHPDSFCASDNSSLVTMVTVTWESWGKLLESIKWTEEHVIEFYTAVRLSRVLNGTLPFYTHFCYSYTDFDWKCAFFNHPIHYHSNPNPGGGGCLRWAHALPYIQIKRLELKLILSVKSAFCKYFFSSFFILQNFWIWHMHWKKFIICGRVDSS